MTILSGGTKHCLVTLLALLLTTSLATAHEDMIAPLAKVEKVYAAPKPLGRLRAVYTGAENAKKPALHVECGLFRTNVPASGLVDLPRPDWGSFSVAYSLTSLESGRWVKRPYLYLTVLVHGPAGTDWQQTWVTFHFDSNGKVVRRIKRFVNDDSSNSVHVLWERWDIGSKVSAESVLKAAQNR